MLGSKPFKKFLTKCKNASLITTWQLCAYPFFAGFYNDDNQWKWKVNDGDGKVFELSNGSFLGITGTGCSVATPDGFVSAACSNANFFVCQTSKYLLV